MPPHDPLGRFLRQALAYLRVDDPEDRSALQVRLGATFLDTFLAGYFEVVSSRASGLIFVDYNRLMTSDLPPLVSTDEASSGERILAVGRAASGGV